MNWTRPTIEPDRVRQYFLDLAGFNSPTGSEHVVRPYCAEALRDVGFLIQTDPAGNLIAQKSGAVSSAPRIFFSGHMDTVRPTEGLVVSESDGVFRTGGDTILGADDKAAVAEIFAGLAWLHEHEIPHGDLQVILSVEEEVGLGGAKNLSPQVIAGSLGFVLDASGPTGSIIIEAPSHDWVEAVVHGRAAHSGFAPEEGVNAIRAAARAIAAMRLGRIDEETTANIGTIQGGEARNIVPDHVRLLGEARSRDEGKLSRQVAHMRGCFENAAREEGAMVEVNVHRTYSRYRFERDDAPLQMAADAWRQLGREPQFRPTGGGSDASVFNERGIPSVVLSCGYEAAHTVHEHVSLRDLVTGAEWVASIAQVAAAR